MELETVKLCFEKYIDFLEKSEHICLEKQYDRETMTIQDMDRLVQITFMNYAVKCNDKINQFSVPCTLYRHIHSLIRQYVQDESNKTISQLNDHIFRLEDENCKLKKDSSNKLVSTLSTTQIQQPIKGWFFN